MPAEEVVAAGAVVARRGGREVLLVHRPKYDDWSFPKGKQEPGEHLTATAVREVAEETGVPVRLGRPLLRQHYLLDDRRMKTVHYWTGVVDGDAETDGDVDGFERPGEIDRAVWVSVDDAETMLTMPTDRTVLADFRTEPEPAHAIVVLRHSAARKRDKWTGPDAERPLKKTGRQQAEALVPLLVAYAPDRVVTSPSVRCRETVAPYVEAASVPLETYPGLSEEDWTLERLDELVTDVASWPGNVLLCSHRPVLPSLLDRLGVVDEPLAPGELVVCHHRAGHLVAVERHLVR